MKTFFKTRTLHEDELIIKSDCGCRTDIIIETDTGGQIIYSIIAEEELDKVIEALQNIKTVLQIKTIEVKQ